MPSWTDLERGAAGLEAQVRSFLQRNEHAITRVLGGLQALGGVGEMGAGVALAAGGVATSELGGLALAGVSSWIVTNGRQNFEAGWRTFLTGETHDTPLHVTLRKMGLSETHALTVEVALAGGAGSAAKLASRELDAAAKAGLARRATRMFTPTPLVVRVGDRSLWEEPDIVKRGLAWEAFDAERTGFDRMVPNFRTFDQVSEDGTVAISNKTLDLVGFSYSREKSRVLYRQMKSYIDQVAAYDPKQVQKVFGDPPNLRERRLHVLMPSGEALPAQELQIAAAEEYAHNLGIILQIEYSF